MALEQLINGNLFCKAEVFIMIWNKNETKIMPVHMHYLICNHKIDTSVLKAF